MILFSVSNLNIYLSGSVLRLLHGSLSLHLSLDCVFVWVIQPSALSFIIQFIHLSSHFNMHHSYFYLVVSFLSFLRIFFFWFQVYAIFIQFCCKLARYQRSTFYSLLSKFFFFSDFCNSDIFLVCFFFLMDQRFQRQIYKRKFTNIL